MTDDPTSSSKVPGPNKTTTHSPREIFEANLFIDVNFLLTNIVIATKSPDGLIDWIELKPEFHSSLVKCVLRLVSKHTATFKTASVKEALFPFLINLLHGRVTCATLIHKVKTAMVSKHVNKEKKVADAEKPKVNVNNAEAKKTPPIQAPSSIRVVHPPVRPTAVAVRRGPGCHALEKKISPTPTTHPPANSEVIPQAQDLDQQQVSGMTVTPNARCVACIGMVTMLLDIRTTLATALRIIGNMTVLRDIPGYRVETRSQANNAEYPLPWKLPD